jgi:conjugative relaxase-like TrwC/TraI family protein
VGVICSGSELCYNLAVPPCGTASEVFGSVFPSCGLFCLVGALLRGGVMSIAKVSPGSAYRYYLKKIAVGDGCRKRGVPLPDAQEQAGVPAGEWAGRGAPLLGLSGVVTEAEMELLFGQGLHPHPEIVTPGVPAGEAPAVRLGRAFIRPTYWPETEADPAEPEAVVPDDGEDPGEKRPRRRKKKIKRGPVAAWDLVVRAPASVQDLWALGDDAARAAIEEAHRIAAGEALAWVEDHAIVVLSGPGGIKRERPVGGVVVARFRHHDSRHRMPLLHDHLVVSVKMLRADGKWGHLNSRTLYENVVTAGALCNQRVLEEVCDRLGLATEARTATRGLRPVMEIAGVPTEVIAWSSTRDRNTRQRLAVLEAECTAGHGYPPTGRVRSWLMKTAANDTRTPKKTPLALALHGPRGHFLTQLCQFGCLDPLALSKRVTGRVVLGSGPCPDRSFRQKAGQQLDQVPLPPPGALSHRLRKVVQQRGRAQRGPVTAPENREILGRLQVDLVHKHPDAVHVGQPDPHPGQTKHRIDVALEPDPVLEPQPPRPRGRHDRPRPDRATTVSAPSAASVRSAASSWRQSRW